MLSGEKDLTKVAKVAEELVRAVSSQIETSDIVSLKELMDAKINTLNQSVLNLKESMDAKINTLNQSVLNLKDELVKLNKKQEEQVKDQRLQWAISNAEFVGSFPYYEKKKGYGEHRQVDGSLVRSILLRFRQGLGWDITKCSMTGYSGYNNDQIAEGEKQFREKLSEQIYDLIGKMPRISLEDGRYSIHYE